MTKLKSKSTNWFTSLNNHACDAHGKKFLFKEDMQSIYSIAQREFDLKCPSVTPGLQRQDDIWNTFFNNAKNSLMIKLRSFCYWYQKSWNKIISIAGIFQKANLEAAVAYCEVIRLSEMTKQKHFKEVRAKLIQSWKQSAKLDVKLLLSKIFNFTYISKWASEIYSSHVKKLTHLESLYLNGTTPLAELLKKKEIFLAKRKLKKKLAAEAILKAAALQLLHPGELGYVYQVGCQYDVQDTWNSPYTGKHCTEWRVATVSKIISEDGSTWLIVSFQNSHVDHDTCIDVTASPHRLASLGTYTGRLADSPRVCPENMRIYPSLPDGNCFFRSVALQVYGDAEKHSQVRIDCVVFFKSHRNEFEAIVAAMPKVKRSCSIDLTVAQRFDLYIDNISTPCTSQNNGREKWGGHLEALALQEIHHRRLDIFIGNNQVKIHLSSDSSLCQKREPIRLSYSGGCHYDSILREGVLFPLGRKTSKRWHTLLMKLSKNQHRRNMDHANTLVPYT